MRTYAARAYSSNAKLSFAIIILTYKAVNPQFSTSLFTVSRSYFAPIRRTLIKNCITNGIYFFCLITRHPLFYGHNVFPCVPSHFTLVVIYLVHQVSFWWRRGVLHPRPVRLSIHIIELYYIYTMFRLICQVPYFDTLCFWFNHYDSFNTNR